VAAVQSCLSLTPTQESKKKEKASLDYLKILCQQFYEDTKEKDENP
jgi:hypothetical protein